MLIGIAWGLLATAIVCSAANFRFPEENPAASVRIDTKVRFIDRDDQQNDRYSGVRSDEIPFKQPTETKGFYNRQSGVDKYPIRTEDDLRRGSYQVSEKPDFPESTSIYPKGMLAGMTVTTANRLYISQRSLFLLDFTAVTISRNGFDSDGTLDSLEYCKCLSTPECSPRSDSEKACRSQRFLCCYKRPNQVNQDNSEFFNEVEDERPMLLPNRENIARPFPPPPGTEINAGFGPGHAHEVGILGTLDRIDEFGEQNGPLGNDGNRRVLVGPGGPTGIIGPAQQNPGVLVGPNGPTGVIGPMYNRRDVGPHSQNIIYPNQSAQRGILVGPGGPTGIIGPAFGRRPILVGPGGPTGIIGPNRPGNRGILVGPGGPTGIIGPGLNRRPRPGYLVQPEGSSIGLGSNQQILVGPGGPTGQIGPQYFSN